VAQRRFRGEIRPLAAEPLYVDPPEARLPGGRPTDGPTANELLI
jgi:tRNA threonylcarbamoyladenosine biosynthesis protein TsaB